MSARAPLVTQVRALLDSATAALTGTPHARGLAAATARLDEPLRVAIAGRVKAGKSTLLNALVGQELAPTDAGECTRIVTWYRDGVTYRVTLTPVGGDPRQVPFRQDEGPIAVDLEGLEPTAVERLEVEWPSGTLKEMTLIDTPGIASVTEALGDRTLSLVTADDEEPSAVDAVVYLMRHLHSSDVRFLQAFQDEDAGRPTPVDALGVLSRADEIGVARLDAMRSAERIAARYRDDPRVRRLCQTVLPVAGLLAQSAVTLTEERFRTIARVAALPRDVTEGLLLSADRFGTLEAEDGPSPEARRRALDALGLFGVRVGVALVRQKVAADAPALAAELVRRSGLDALREALATRFSARRDLLQARSALRAVEAALRANGGEPRELASEAERVRASAHEFAEMRLLILLRAGAAGLPDAEAEEAERIVTEPGVAERLGLPADAAPDAVLSALGEGVARWRERAESPLSSRARADAAAVIVRSLEGIAAAVAAS